MPLPAARAHLYQLRILSLGAGVQSTAIFLMSIKEILPKPHLAIFADTGWETMQTYQHLEWLEQMGKEHGIPVVRVSGGSIRDGLINCAETRHAAVPYFIATSDGYGLGRRQCTKEYKLDPIRRKTRELLGIRPGQRAPQGSVEQWIGISMDELRRTRIYKPDRMAHVRFPLVEWVQMSRTQCIRWIDHHFPGHVPPKSSCIGCPYHTDHEWRSLTDEEFHNACEVDEAIRSPRGLKNPAYLHRSCVPLSEVNLTDNQMRLFDPSDDKNSIILSGLAEI